LTKKSFVVKKLRRQYLEKEVRKGRKVIGKSEEFLKGGGVLC